MEQTSRAWFSRASALVAVLLFLYAIGLILYPFLSALLAAATVALMLHPLRQRLLAKAPGHPFGVSALLTALTFLLFVLPLSLAAWALLREARHAYPAIRQWMIDSSLSSPGIIGDTQDPLHAWGMDPKRILLDNLEEISSWAGHFVRSTIKNVASIATNLIIFGAFLFFFFRNGPKLIARGIELIPMPGRQTARILDRIQDVLGATVRGILLVALVQGAFAWIGFSLFGAPFPVLLAALCMMLSPIPMVGGALVWVPVVAKIAIAGDYAKAIPLLLWFALIYSFIDNLARPLFIGAQTKIPVALVLIGVLGGMSAFGFAGMFIGPVLVAVAMVGVEMLQEHDRERRGGS